MATWMSNRPLKLNGFKTDSLTSLCILTLPSPPHRLLPLAQLTAAPCVQAQSLRVTWNLLSLYQQVLFTCTKCPNLPTAYHLPGPQPAPGCHHLSRTCAVVSSLVFSFCPHSHLPWSVHLYAQQEYPVGIMSFLCQHHAVAPCHHRKGKVCPEAIYPEASLPLLLRPYWPPHWGLNRLLYSVHRPLHMVFPLPGSVFPQKSRRSLSHCLQVSVNTSTAWRGPLLHPT